MLFCSKCQDSSSGECKPCAICYKAMQFLWYGSNLFMFVLFGMPLLFGDDYFPSFMLSLRDALNPWCPCPSLASVAMADDPHYMATLTFIILFHVPYFINALVCLMIGSKRFERSRIFYGISLFTIIFQAIVSHWIEMGTSQSFVQKLIANAHNLPPFLVSNIIIWRHYGCFDFLCCKKDQQNSLKKAASKAASTSQAASGKKKQQ